MSLEEKIIGILCIIAIVVTGASYFAVKLIAAGKAECEAKVEAMELKSKQDAEKQDKLWTDRLNTAVEAKNSEIDDLKNITLKPATVSVQRYTLRPLLSPGAGAASGASPATPGHVPETVLPESPEQLQRDFDAARSCDILVADYRELYNAWPVASH